MPSMLLRDFMLADLECGLAIVRDGYEVVPSWRILTPEGDFMILTRFDPDKPQQRERALALVPRFMAWKLASAFVLTAEMWLGPERARSGEEAVMAIGVSHHERLGLIRRIQRTPSLAFTQAEWLPADMIDETYFRLLPSGASTVTPEEAVMLAGVFGERRRVAGADGLTPGRPGAGVQKQSPPKKRGLGPGTIRGRGAAQVGDVAWS